MRQTNETLGLNHPSSSAERVMEKVHFDQRVLVMEAIGNFNTGIEEIEKKTLALAEIRSTPKKSTADVLNGGSEEVLNGGEEVLNGGPDL